MKKKGSALLVVIIVMMVTFVLAAFIVDISIKSNRVNQDTLNKTKAYYSAESGVYDLINYFNNNKSSIGSGATITSNAGGLYGDNMAVYKANIMDAITTSQTGTSTIYTFSIYSYGTYGSQNCIIEANVSITYTDNIYSNYVINLKKVYRA